MISAEFQPNLFNEGEQVIVDDPLVFLEMYVKDHRHQYRFHCVNWDRSHSDIYSWKRNGADIVGLSSYRSLSSAYIETDRVIQEGGLYWVLLRTLKQPWSGDKQVSVLIDDELVGSVNTNHQTEHYRYIDLGYITLSSGTHNFRVNFNGKDAWADHLILYKLDYYSSEESKSRYRLDWNSIEFTQNTLGDINTADITLPLRPSWNDPNRNIHSRQVFDRTDMLNIMLGSKPDDMKVRFGGYLLGHSINDERNQLTLHFADTLIDLYRRPNYANYFIGITPNSDETFNFPIYQFGSSFEAIRHLSDTQEWGILAYNVSYPYRVYKNFKLLSDFNSITTTGFTKQYNPASGLVLGYDKLAVGSCGVVVNGDCEAILFNSPSHPFNAVTDNILYIQYMATGVSCNPDNRVQFNIEVEMYREGESPSNAQTYTILFTGKAGASNIIGTAPQVFDGKPQVIKFDLKKAFDSYVNGGNYYVTKVSLVDTHTVEQAVNRGNSTITLLEFGAYPDTINKTFKLTSETSYPYENLVEIVDKLGFVCYVDYGNRRGLDVLCVAPEMNTPSMVEAVSGVNAFITDDTYETRESLRNARLLDYSYRVGDEEHTGRAYAENVDSIIRYGPGAWESYESSSEIGNQTDAEIEARQYVEKNSYPMKSFTLVLLGCPLLNPSEYIVSRLDNEYLTGNYSTKTVTYSLSREQSPKCLTRISVNRPGSYYNRLMNRLDEKLEKYLNIENRRQYDRRSLSNMDLISPGTYIRSGGYG